MFLRVPCKLTFAVASMFSGSTRVRSSPISCTAPPSSGSVSQIMCSMIRLIRRMSWKANKKLLVTQHSFISTCVVYISFSDISSWLCSYTHIIILLRLLHDELSYHRGVVLHQIRENICGCPTHLNIIHSLYHEHRLYLSEISPQGSIKTYLKTKVIIKKKKVKQTKNQKHFISFTQVFFPFISRVWTESRGGEANITFTMSMYKSVYVLHESTHISTWACVGDQPTT